MRHLITVRLRLEFVLCSLVAVPLAMAQDEASVVPVAIPLADVAARSEELGANLRRVEALLAPSYEIQAIEAAVGEAGDVLAELRRKLDALNDDEISMRMLSDHRLSWGQFDQKLAVWMTELQERWQTLAQEGTELSAARDEWRITREDVIGDDAPIEIIEQIDRLLVRVDVVDSRLAERGDALGSVLARVSQGREISAEAIDRLSAIAAKIRARVWTRNTPPLWRLSESSQGATIRASAHEAQKYWRDTLVSFILARRERFLFLLACFVTFLFAALLARRASRSWPSDEHRLDSARFVVSRPVSTAVAFTVVAMVFLLDNTVGAVEDMVLILAVVPVVRLGRGLLPVPALSALYGAMVLLVFNRLWALAPDGSFLRRILLILVTALALGAVAALISRWRQDERTKVGAWWRFAWFLLFLASVILTVSLVANVLGWENLAETLTDATTTAAFGGAAWATVVLALTALIPVAIRSPLGAIFPSVRRHGDMFARGVFFIAAGSAFFWWSRATLGNYQLLEPVTEKAAAVLSAAATVGGLDVSVGRVVASIVILVATWLLARMTRFVLREEVLPRVRLPAGADHSVVSVANYVLWGSGLLLAAAAGGLSGTQLTVVFGALGVGIGFGLQNIVSNFVSGLILIFERPIKVGDRVETKDHFGIVTGIGIRASTIQKFDGAEVVVPNGDLVSKELVNWTRTDMTRRVEIRVHVALGADPKQVMEILRAIAIAHPKTLDSPAPSALMTGFGESALEFRLLAWTGVDSFLQVSSDLHVSVNDELKGAGIEIPFPQRDLHVHPTESGKVV